MVEAVDLSERAKQKEQEKAQEQQVIHADTAFIIFRDKETREIKVTPDLTTIVVADHPPDANELWNLAGTVVRDVEAELNASLTAQRVVQANMQIARQMQEQQFNQQIMRDGKLPAGFGGGK